MALQWGHALSGMDISAVCVVDGYPPSSFNGAMPFQAWIYWTDGISTRIRSASMGPCLFRHGYDPQIPGRYTPPDRFNGAMPFQAWIQPIIGSMIFQTVSLQWGHALSGMDTRNWRCPACGDRNRFNGAMPFQAWIPEQAEQADETKRMLQWGHALSGMDTPKPRSGDEAWTELQWGHALSGMDTG